MNPLKLKPYRIESLTDGGYWLRVTESGSHDKAKTALQQHRRKFGSRVRIVVQHVIEMDPPL